MRRIRAEPVCRIKWIRRHDTFSSYRLRRKLHGPFSYATGYAASYVLAHLCVCGVCSVLCYVWIWTPHGLRSHQDGRSHVMQEHDKQPGRRFSSAKLNQKELQLVVNQTPTSTAVVHDWIVRYPDLSDTACHIYKTKQKKTPTSF